MGAYPGRGKRSGTFGTYLMASYDDLRGVYQTVCKLGTGFSEENLLELQKMVEPFISKHEPINVESDTKAPIWINPGIVFEMTLKLLSGSILE
ncbi:MAG: ATP dependent DNA ligase [Candidatus Hodarchaeales archaeon]